MKKGLRSVLLVLFAAIFLVSAFFLGKYLIESARSQNQFDALTQIRDQVLVEVSPEWLDSSPEKPAQVTPPPADRDEPDTPAPETEPQLLPEYAPLYEMNSDLVGWITIENTVIDYPVMQRQDERDYYLYRDFYGEENVHGCIYVREQCDVFAPSDNVVIYGHRMKDGSMFRQLLEYEDPEFYAEHPTVIFDTIYEHHTYQIIAVFKTTMDENGFAFHHFNDAFDAEEFDAYVATCKELALYDIAESAVYGDRLITLATCEYSQNAGRMVIVAKRIN